MSNTIPDQTIGAPDKVHPAVRTTAYWVLFALSIIGLLGVGLSPIWWPELSDKIGQTWIVVSNAFGVIAGGLGVIYRPTASAGNPVTPSVVADPVTASDAGTTPADTPAQS